MKQQANSKWHVLMRDYLLGLLAGWLVLLTLSYWNTDGNSADPTTPNRPVEVTIAQRPRPAVPPAKAPQAGEADRVVSAKALEGKIAALMQKIPPSLADREAARLLLWEYAKLNPVQALEYAVQNSYPFLQMDIYLDYIPALLAQRGYSVSELDRIESETDRKQAVKVFHHMAGE